MVFMRIKAKILQTRCKQFLHKMWKPSKKLHQKLWFEGPIKILGTEVFRDRRQPEEREFFTPSCTVDWTRDWCSALQRSMLGAGKSTLQQTASRSCG